MLLETLENNNEDIIIFSRNILNNDENFRMIIKSDPSRSEKNLFLYDLCGLINHPVHKNIILYRLLTNFSDFSVAMNESGCLLKVDDREELFYPDPIYAVHELEKIAEDRYLPNLRFRIQQVGLCTSYLKEKEVQFRELFYFDLDAIEAQVQNDSVFLPALLPDKKMDRKTLIENISYSDGRNVQLKNLRDDNEDSSESEFSLHLLAGFHLNERIQSPEMNKSSIEIFHSDNKLKNYIRQKLGVKKILRLKK